MLISIGFKKKRMYQDIGWFSDYIPKRGKIFLDIGANRGEWVKAMKNSFTEIHAFEPDSRPFHELDKLTDSRIHTYNIGLWNVSKILKLKRYDNSEQSTFSEEHPLGHGTSSFEEIEIDCKTLDSFSIKDVSLIKIDVEGAEVEVVEGAMETITLSKPSLVIEIHKYENIEKIKELLNFLDYKITVKEHPTKYNKNHQWMFCN